MQFAFTELDRQRLINFVGLLVVGEERVGSQTPLMFRLFAVICHSDGSSHPIQYYGHHDGYMDKDNLMLHTYSIPACAGKKNFRRNSIISRFASRINPWIFWNAVVLFL